MGAELIVPEQGESFIHKWISVEKLKELLSTLEDTDELVPNQVRNLTIYRMSPGVKHIGGDPEFVYWGYVDISSEEIKKNQNEEKDE